MNYTARQRFAPEQGLLAPPPDGYLLFDGDLSWQKVLQKDKRSISFGIGGQNLFNRAYRSYLNTFRYFANEQGRQVSLRCKYQF
jgi:iron complex outermembrane recepter protein